MKHVGLVILFALSFSLPDIPQANAENILVVAFFSSKSHKLTYVPVIEELGNRGHNVTMITPIRATKQMKNVQDLLTVDWEELEKVYKKEQGFDPFAAKERGENMNPFLMIGMFEDLCKRTYDLPLVKQILTEKFDLIIVQPTFNECAMGLVHKLKAPVVIWSPMGVGGFIASKVGGHLPHSFIPNIFLGSSEDMNFIQRMANFGMNVAFETLLRFYYEPAMTAIYREKLGQDVPEVYEIMGNASLVLSNGHFSLHRPKPLFPDIVEVGGLHSFVPVKPLPREIEEFIQKGKKGFIFFSMGSHIKASTMAEAKRKLFLNVFSKLDQQILWKWETETMPDLPKNLKLSKWLPQQDLLAHKDIKMFITHCGGGSTEEAVYNGVPLLGFPMFGDQMVNSQLGKKHGMLMELDWNEVTEETLLAGIREILDDPKYLKNAKKVSELFKDQPDKPMDRAVYWIEYVIRHKGATHLRSAGRKLNWFQYHSYDVVLAYFGIIGVVLYLVFAILRWIVRKTCCRLSSSSSRSSNKKKPKRE